MSEGLNVRNGHRTQKRPSSSFSDCRAPGVTPMTTCGALQPLATTFPLVASSLYRGLEIAAISAAVVPIW
jgi:hypothetical protein